MLITTKSGRKVYLPTPEEDAEITAGASVDPDNPLLTDEELAQFKPMRGRGRPAGSGKKEQISLRVDADVLDKFRQSGDGWQTRMNDALKDWLETHRVA